MSKKARRIIIYDENDHSSQGFPGVLPWEIAISVTCWEGDYNVDGDPLDILYTAKILWIDRRYDIGAQWQERIYLLDVSTPSAAIRDAITLFDDKRDELIRMGES